MAPRSQPYRLQAPLTDPQVESIDEMFQILFDDIGNDSIFPATVTGDMLYRDTERLTRLPIGDANTVIRTDGVVPEWGKVDLASDVDDVLPIANGGTNSTATATAGAVAYGTGTAYAFSAAGTTGQMLISGGTGSPTWTEAGLSPAQVMTRVVLGI